MRETIKKLQTFFSVLLGVAIPTSIAASGIIMGILALLWIFEGGFNEKLKQIISSKWMLAVLALISFYGLAMLWGDNHNNSSWIFQKIS